MAVSLTHPPPSTTSDTKSEPSNKPLLASAESAENMKRKPSRRANTAERRATHNAVERQRRETLNGRFLDLAGLLPNLSQIRRPSKSSIVNSSIAHVHASRRHRMLAARELRILKQEADALRRELNEWRDRAGLPRVDEPVRSEGFTTVLGGEMELEMMQEDAEDQDEGDELDFGGAFTTSDDVPAVKKGQAPTFTNNINNSAGYTPSLHQQPQLIGANNGNNHNNNTFAYGHTNSPYSAHPGYLPEPEKISTWNAQLYAALASHGGHSPQQNGRHGLPMYTQTQSPQHTLLPTPPSTSHSHSGQDFFGGRRERSGSLSTSGSSFGSPPTYDFDAHHTHGLAVPHDKRGLQIDTELSSGGSFGTNWQQSPVVSIGNHGGSGNGGFMMMMM
jgi:hypothetical protein